MPSSDSAPHGAASESPLAHFERGSSLAARGDFAGAVDAFLEVVRRDRNFEDEAGRRALLALFALLGDDDPLTRDGRGRLSSVLF
jgi:putative thioredoxin